MDKVTSGEGLFVVLEEVIDGSFYLADGPCWDVNGCDSIPECGSE